MPPKFTTGGRRLAPFRFLPVIGEAGMWADRLKAVAEKVSGPVCSFSMGIVNSASAEGVQLASPVVGSAGTAVYNPHGARNDTLPEETPMLVRTLLTATLLCSIAFAQQQSNYPPNMPEARIETYKSVEGTDLKMWIFEPEGHKASDSSPAIVFFFGGGWRNGTPGQFHQQAMHLAARGMVAMAADYRVLNRQGVKVHKCVQDAKSAIRWVRTNAKRLGIDPNRLAAGGGSAGGHLAASTASLPDHDDPAGDKFDQFETQRAGAFQSRNGVGQRAGKNRIR